MSLSAHTFRYMLGISKIERERTTQERDMDERTVKGLSAFALAQLPRSLSAWQADTETEENGKRQGVGLV